MKLKSTKTSSTVGKIFISKKSVRLSDRQRFCNTILGGSVGVLTNIFKKSEQDESLTLIGKPRKWEKGKALTL